MLQTLIVVLGFPKLIWYMRIDKQGFPGAPKIKTSCTSTCSGFQSVKFGFAQRHKKQNNVTSNLEICFHPFPCKSQKIKNEMNEYVIACFFLPFWGL